MEVHEKHNKRENGIPIPTISHKDYRELLIEKNTK